MFPPKVLRELTSQDKFIKDKEASFLNILGNLFNFPGIPIYNFFISFNQSRMAYITFPFTGKSHSLPSLLFSSKLTAVIFFPPPFWFFSWGNLTQFVLTSYLCKHTTCLLHASATYLRHHSNYECLPQFPSFLWFVTLLVPYFFLKVLILDT